MNLLDSSLIYKGQEKILVAVDCIIFGFDSEKLKLLLFRRKVEPLKGEWSLVGAFIKNNLSLNNAAKQILLELSGLENNYLQELQTYSKVDRDPGERVISVAFLPSIMVDPLFEVADLNSNLPELANLNFVQPISDQQHFPSQWLGSIRGRTDTYFI